MTNTYYVAGVPFNSYDSLTHHGIKGQKWGTRNGPPYPLDAEDHSEREKRANYKNSLDKNESQLGNWNDKHHLTKRQKAMIAAGVVAVAAIGAAVIYEKKLVKSVLASWLAR